MAINEIREKVKQGFILRGSKFSEPMLVINEPRRGDGYLEVDLVGTRTQKFRGGVSLTEEDLRQLEIESPEITLQGNPHLFQLGLEAIRIRLAYEYDPFFALSISRIDPLPHQLDAVYNHMLKAWRCRFLLADDAGAGKTIMAGLLLKELKLRGVERVLIVCPANLAFQWWREMWDRFDEDFELITGSKLREKTAVNVWSKHDQVITSMDLAKLKHIVPSVEQADDWDLVIVDEAHRMSARDAAHKSERYRLGELLGSKTAHFLLLTATPHKGDPDNFCLFLQLLDQEAYADVSSIREAMDRREAPFYLRRTKEAMLSFPKRQPDGTWVARKLFTERIPHTVAFELEGEELNLYRSVTHYVQTQSRRAAERGDDKQARAVGFLMAMYQRRMASSIYALIESLSRRRKKLLSQLDLIDQLGEVPIPELPSDDELEEMDAETREELERQMEQATLARRRPDLEEELDQIESLIKLAEGVEGKGEQVKLTNLRKQLTERGIFGDGSLRLLIFTEYRDTLHYLVNRLRDWGLTVGYIHGRMKPGGRDQPGTRLHSEHQFWELNTQVLVATEAAGEGINLHCCNILFNYDIPWNPNRLEQRMGRIHRYGQTKDCLIFNFFARNTVEGRVLLRLLDKLQEIRDALEDDTVFDVVGEVLPANQIEELLRDFYAGRLGEEDIHSRLDVVVNKEDFEHICRSALEGLAKHSLNLPMLVEQRALAQERRIVPETIERFFKDAIKYLGIELRAVENQKRAYRVGSLPAYLYEMARGSEWHWPALAKSYDRITFERSTSKADPRFDWVTPGHPLFEVIRRKIEEDAMSHLRKGTVFYELTREGPSMLELYTASVVDGTGKTLHQRLFAMETTAEGERRQREPMYILGLISSDKLPEGTPEIPLDEEYSRSFLIKFALEEFRQEVISERQKDLDLIERHVKLCFKELIQRRDKVLSKHLLAREPGDPTAEGLIEIESQRILELQRRRGIRLAELRRQRDLSLQDVKRVGIALVLPHPERVSPGIPSWVYDPETERIAMEAVIAYEEARGSRVEDVHKKNLGYDLKSLNHETGELRLIEVKGVGRATGTIPLTPNERRVAQDLPDLYWLYIVTQCDTNLIVQEPIPKPARLPWHEVVKVDHYWLTVDALTKPMTLREDRAAYTESK